MTRFDRGSVSLAVHAVGDGRPFLFQHGLCGDAAQTADVLPKGIGWRGLTLESRGHGRSDAGPLDALSLATFADDLAAFLDQEVGGPVVLGGISMGAALALRLAVTRPDRVAGLVLARPAWLWDAAPSNLAPYALVGDLLARHEPGQARAAFEATDTARTLAQAAPDNLASLLGFFDRQPVPVTAALLSRIAADGPGLARDDIAAIRVPTLVIAHGRDLAHPLSHALTLARLIPGSHLSEITPKADDRDRYRRDFAAALSTFLQELPA
ncbi:alpha/beta fold hydrolase [Rubellimicrobium arenae]|uniref:alpha/beta fold hydrolase n=1 Tax=Rubellimicrobium arenae TaxID=2817372 RepID=UPI001B306C27